MKSFSAAGFGATQADQLEWAAAAVKKNPQALFTAFQWFLYKSQNTVYFTAYSQKVLDKEALLTIVANMVTLAPQLTHGFVGARPGQPLPRRTLEDITSIVEVDNFDGMPDAWLDPGLDLFDQPDMPLFRVRAAVRRGGVDEKGRGSMIMVRSSHALMEGSDSSLLTRSQPSGHGTISATPKRVPLGQRLKYASIAALTAPIHLVMANLLSPARQEMGFSTVALERQRLRSTARRLGIRQRSLMFALVMYALNDGGKGFGEKEIKSVYTTLDGDRHEADDDFFRVRTINATFGVEPDLETFCRSVDAKIAEVESKDTTHMQFVLNATFKTHRFLSRIFPFFYSPRFFRYNGDFGIVLTLVPPHRVYGNLTHGMMEPIYCGSYHPGSNLCSFVPAREYVTLNFSTRVRHLAHVDKIARLLDQLDPR